MGSSDIDQFNNVSAALSIGEAFWSRARAHPDSPLFRYAVAPHADATRVWRSETYASVTPAIARIAHHLSALGVRPGTPVAILSHTRAEWLLADIAIQTLGGITVSIYQSQPAVEVGFVLHDSGARIVFIENEEQAQKISWLKNNLCTIPEREGILASTVQVQVDTVINFEQIDKQIDTGLPSTYLADLITNPEISATPPTVPDSINHASIASYVYTSGTTGAPKGVIQSHGNHLSNVRQAAEGGIFVLDGSLFLYLPLAHSFARLVYYVGALTSAYLALPAIVDHKTSKIDLSSIAKDLRESGASVIPSVPRLFEKMAAVLQSRASGKGLQQRILALCISNAQKTYERRFAKAPLSLLEQILFYGLAPIREKIKRQLFGVGFRHAISGGAKLDPGINKFFDALEITICEGYGLTETCVATHVNRPSHRRIGSVGPALDQVETRILAEDGEILLRGPNVTRGYLNRPLATKESWDNEGWFHTGDIGKIDPDGFLFITDRKKELVITAGGKKIPPTLIEGLFKRNSFISHAFLYGDGKPYCVMLFTLNDLELRNILSASGVKIAANTKLSDLTIVIKMVQDAVDRANKELASYETIKHFSIIDQDFSLEDGLLTPTMKMKRKQITLRYRDTIDSLYS